MLLPLFTLSMGVLFLAIAVAGWGKWQASIRRLIFFWTTVFFMVCSGFVITYLHDIRNDTHWFGHYIHDPMVVRVTGYPVKRAATWRLPVCVLQCIRRGELQQVYGTAVLYVAQDSLPVPAAKGDTLIVTSKWHAIRNSRNPYEFDYARYCARSNIFLQAFCHRDDILSRFPATPLGLPMTERVHDIWMQQIDRYITDSAVKGLVQAMVVGDVVNLDQSIEREWSMAGIVHIIAISGGNVMVFFTLISWSLFLVRSSRHNWIKYLIALPLVWFYVVMAGCPPSAIRAAIGYSIITGGLILRRQSNPLNHLAAAAFIMLVYQPGWLFSLGFQLSFLAVLSLILFYRPIYKLCVPPNKVIKKLWQTASGSIAAEILVAPLVVCYFHNFPLLFVFSNVLALVFMEIVQFLGLLLAGVGALPALAHWLGVVIIYMVSFFNFLIRHIELFNPAGMQRLRLTPLELILVYVFIIGMATISLRGNRKGLFVALTSGILLVAIDCVYCWQDLHRQILIVYNTAHRDYIELVDGNQFEVLQMDSTAIESIERARMEAHIRWQLPEWNRPIDLTGNDNACFRVGRHSVLLLRSVAELKDPFHVDYVVCEDSNGVNKGKIAQMFTPSLIVYGNNVRLVRERNFHPETTMVPTHRMRRDGTIVIGQ